MADRSVTAYLKANVSGFTSGLATASAGTASFTGGLERASKSSAAGFNNIGKAVTGVGLAAAGLAVAAVASFATFDAAMSNVEAATHETAAGMEQLGDAALDAGAKTVFSATEAAGGIEELAKAGLTTTDIIGGGLAGALDLAAAGGLDVARAAELTATALSVFNLEGDQASHVADLLAAGAGKAQGSVEDMGAALNQSALVADQVGLSIEETAGSLALFASNGLLGSDAGTSFRTMLMRLTNPTDEAKTALDELGISVYDSQGQFVGMESIAGQLQSRMSGLDEETRNAALGTIFGADAIRSASILYQEGAAGVAEWTEKVNDTGYAAETAATRLDNLRGDLEALSGSIETALIGLGESADGPLRSLVEWLTNVVNGFNDLSPEVQSAVLVVVGLTAAVGLLGGGFLLLVPKVLAAKVALTELGVTATGAKIALGGLVAILGGVTAAFLLFDQLDPALTIDDATRSLKELAKTGEIVGALAGIDDGMIGIVGTGGDLSTVLREAREEMDNWWDALDNWVGSSAGEEIAVIDEALAGLVSSGHADTAAAAFRQIAADGAEAGLSLTKLVELFPEYAGAAADMGVDITAQKFIELADTARMAREEISGHPAVYEGNTEAVDALNESFDVMGEAIPELTEYQAMLAESLGISAQAAVDLSNGFADAREQMDILNGGTLDAMAAEIAYQEQLDKVSGAVTQITEDMGGLSEAVNESTGRFDTNTEAGRLAEQMMIDQAKAAAEDALAASELAGETGGASEAQRVLEGKLADSRAALVETGIQLGLTRGDAEKYADQILQTPTTWVTYFKADTSAAMGNLAVLQTKIDGLRGRTIYIDIEYQGGGPLQGLATGGYVPAQQGGTARLLGEGGEGEWVVPDSKVDSFIDQMVARGQSKRYGHSAPSTPAYQMIPYPMHLPPSGGSTQQATQAVDRSMTVTINAVRGETDIAAWHRARRIYADVGR